MENRTLYKACSRYRPFRLAYVPHYLQVRKHHASQSHSIAASSSPATPSTRDWSLSSNYELIRNKFVTGDWSEGRNGEEEDGEEDEFGIKKKEQKDSDDEEDAKKLHRKDRKNRRKNVAEDEHASRRSLPC